MAKKAITPPISDQAVLQKLNELIVARGISKDEIAEELGHIGDNRHGHISAYFNQNKKSGMRWSRFVEIVNAVRFLSQKEVDFNELFKAQKDEYSKQQLLEFVKFLNLKSTYVEIPERIVDEFLKYIEQKGAKRG